MQISSPDIRFSMSLHHIQVTGSPFEKRYMTTPSCCIVSRTVSLTLFSSPHLIPHASFALADDDRQRITSAIMFRGRETRPLKRIITGSCRSVSSSHTRTHTYTDLHMLTQLHNLFLSGFKQTGWADDFEIVLY